jgi:hypothetical protein
MTFQKKSFEFEMRSSRCALVASLLLGLALQSQGTIYTLTEGDSSVKVNDASGGGQAYDWTVGGVNQLFFQWYYYRLGNSGPEYAIDSIDATPTSVLDPNGRKLTTTYANSTISVEVVFELVDGISSGVSAFNHEVTVNNLSGVATNLSFFQYSDYDLGGGTPDQSVNFFAAGGKFYKAIQTDGAWVLTETVLSNPSVGTTVRAEAALYNSTLTSLTDLNTTTLNNVTTAGPGDITYAFQWSRSLAAGGSFQLSKLQGIVPEPSSISLMGVAMVLWGLVRRRAKGERP